MPSESNNLREFHSSTIVEGNFFFFMKFYWKNTRQRNQWKHGKIGEFKEVYIIIYRVSLTRMDNLIESMRKG